MKYQTLEYQPTDLATFKQKALNYASQFDKVFYSDSHGINFPHKPFDCILAFKSLRNIRFTGNDDLQILENDIAQNKSWLFGHFNYDLKNQTENLQSENDDSILFPLISFFEPEFILRFLDQSVELIFSGQNNQLIELIEATEIIPGFQRKKHDVSCTTPKSEYLQVVNQLKKHIEEGDIYEINYCIEFLIKEIDILPVSCFWELIQISPSPFSLFYKLDQHFLLCASPERFMKKEEKYVISQPIKGTARRGVDEDDDIQIKQALRNSEKELAENMMIVDLVRNDLARSCEPGSVKVDEMFGIYTFKYLHQMISTVSGKLRSDVSAVQAIKNAFPMGSMTGAPKIKVMELIEQYEKSKRGLYSGSVGYFTPEGNFDFNVVIRSLLYNQSNSTASFQVGSAITFDADAEQEYEECMLKASALRTLLEGQV